MLTECPRSESFNPGDKALYDTSYMKLKLNSELTIKARPFATVTEHRKEEKKLLAMPLFTVVFIDLLRHAHNIFGLVLEK